MNGPVPRTIIEFVDGRRDDSLPRLHVAKEIWINGTRVCVAKNGIKVEFGENDATVVTLQIQPTELLFTHRDEQGEPK